jgi:bacterioferritin (cytochrome b1)
MYLPAHASDKTNAKMREQLCVSIVSGRPKSQTKTVSTGSTMNDLVSDLTNEKRASVELLDVVNSQSDQIDELANIVREAENHQVDMEARIDKLDEIILDNFWT